MAEHRTDKWFDNPCGWLLGPGEKRGATAVEEEIKDDKNTLGKKVANFVSTPYYTKRWFVLDTHNKTLKYYKDEHTRVESGCIDMATVIDIQSCTDPYAPTHAFDLVGRGGRCSLAAQTYEDVIKWCYCCEDVIKHIEPVARSDLSEITSSEGVAARNSPRGDNITDDKRWHRYNYVFPEAGPLMLNVVGLTDQDANGTIQSHWLLVTSFARYPDGRLGNAEKSSIIKIKDYIVGVNNVDLTILPYHDAMVAMRNATFPKTVYFLRDLQNKQETLYLESWAYVYYEALNRRRKRYIELDSDNISFRKPTVSGSTSVKRDSSFAIDQIAHIQPLIDHNYDPSDSQHILRIVCHPGASISLIGNDELIVGSININTIDLYFNEISDLNEWVRILTNASLRPRRNNTTIIPNIPVIANGVIEKSEDNKQFIDILSIKSYVTGIFTPRQFTITPDGYLLWKRISTTKAEIKRSSARFSKDKGRRIFIGNDLTCTLRGVYAGEDSAAEDENNRYTILYNACIVIYD